MKISKICALALAGALCSEVMAEGAFVGIESDYAFKTKLKLDITDIADGDAKDAQPALCLKFGYDLDNFRIYTSYMHDFTAKDSDSQTSMGVQENAKLEWKKNSLLLGADFTPSINNYFRFLAGGFIGYTKTKVDLQYRATGAITEIMEGKETFKGFCLWRETWRYFRH